jgi:hypothetical protein
LKKKPYSQHYNEQGKTESISSKIRNETMRFTLSNLFYVVLEFLAKAIRQDKEIKGIQIGKEEVKLFLLADAMILYLEDFYHGNYKALKKLKIKDRKIFHLMDWKNKYSGNGYNTKYIFNETPSKF